MTLEVDQTSTKESQQSSKNPREDSISKKINIVDEPSTSTHEEMEEIVTLGTLEKMSS